MGMQYLDDQGKTQTPIMGCYGIGIGRLMASIIESKHDDYGPLWPVSVAPFKVHIVTIDLNEEKKQSYSLPEYKELLKNGIEVIYDDRKERPGAKFADADLIGAPYRLIFSKRNFSEGKVEFKRRGSQEKEMIDQKDIVNKVMELLK